MPKQVVTFIVGLLIVVVGFSVGARARQTAAPLQAIGDMLVGNWTGEGVYAADYPGVGKKGEKFTSTSTCRWAAGRAAIVCEGKGNQTTWTQLIFWDPATKQIRTTAVDSGGNFDQGTGSKQGDKLVWSSAGSFADGRAVEYKWETTFSDNGNTRIETGATILGGVRSEFRDTYKRTSR